ncbi:PREDICTED: E3 ubiquitin-protein ligase PDZRN3 isoform X2 [Nicrophorus vespilloides]|uniref:E3 ubiquitin-protein ligase PDZRN3 isoform X2 n=1 Tax=Nicrophorus vespilloides TaxID=110193 RepID=A0ABM1MHJ2_NICVS|nr:PREDICTED: E3 ubiquitin-protein ligase PDZRN3 isoform X2 [Nicrophorus vespilloides]
MDFVILKVNGTDVSSFPHEDAVRTFLTAQEPIVVEVKRRTPEEFQVAANVATPADECQAAAAASMGVVSTGVQTEFPDFTWIDDNTLECFSQEIDFESEDYLDAEAQGDASPNCKSAAYQNSIIEQLVQQQTESHHSGKVDVPPPHVPPHFMHDTLNLTNSLVRSKIDSIAHEMSELDHRMQNIQLVKSDKRKPPQLPHIPAPVESDTEHIYETIPESVDSELEPIYSCPYEANDENMVEQWLKAQDTDWNGQPKEIVVTKETKAKEKSRSKSSKSNSSGEEHENSSSAYNTGGSCNSNPLTFELACSLESKHNRSTLILCPPGETTESCETLKHTKTPARSKTKASSSKVNSPSSPTVRPGLNVPMLSDTMYTNAANLRQTILLQQQLFRQSLGQSNHETNRPTTSFTAPSLSQYQFISSQQNYTNTRTESTTMDTAMEWKVKRRPDGSRYIARRPVRNRILRNREIRISEERAGLTTEDDTISELKIGRYWTKEERKKHLEKSKERKQRQEILMAAKNIDENGDFIFHKTLDKSHGSMMNKKAANNLDNTVKKHKSTKKSQKSDVYENFSTVQEVLVHGNKVSANQNSKMIGLLSVTTV